MTEFDWSDSSDPQPMLAFLRDIGRTTDRNLSLFCVACCRRVWYLLTPDYVQGCLEAIDAREQYADRLVAEAQVRSAESTAYGEARNVVRGVAHPGQANSYATAYAGKATSFGGPAAMHVAAAAGRAAGDAARAAAYDTVAQAAEPTVAAITAAWEEPPRGEGRDWRSDEAAITSTPAYLAGMADACAAQAALLRCIFGNPFRAAPTLAPSIRTWNGGSVVRLAEAVYEDRVLPAGTFRPDHLAILADALEDGGSDDAELLGHLRGPGPHVRGCHVVDLLLNRS
jgi:hypothetical protein